MFPMHCSPKKNLTVPSSSYYQLNAANACHYAGTIFDNRQKCNLLPKMFQICFTSAIRNNMNLSKTNLFLKFSLSPLLFGREALFPNFLCNHNFHKPLSSPVLICLTQWFTTQNQHWRLNLKNIPRCESELVILDWTLLSIVMCRSTVFLSYFYNHRLLLSPVSFFLTN